MEQNLNDILKKILHNVVDCQDISPDGSKNLLRKFEIGHTRRIYEEMGIKDVNVWSS